MSFAEGYNTRRRGNRRPPVVPAGRGVNAHPNVRQPDPAVNFNLPNFNFNPNPRAVLPRPRLNVSDPGFPRSPGNPVFNFSTPNNFQNNFRFPSPNIPRFENPHPIRFDSPRFRDVNPPQAQSPAPMQREPHLYPEIIVLNNNDNASIASHHSNRSTPTPVSAANDKDLNSDLLSGILDGMNDMKLQFQNELADFKTEIKNEIDKVSAAKPVVPVNLIQSQPDSSVVPPPNKVVSSERKSKTSFSFKSLKELPKFNGSLDPLHPKDFISNLKCFKETQDVSDSNLLYGIKISLLTDSALTWYQVYCDTFGDNFEMFCSEFVKYFWNKGLQNKLRSAILAPTLVAPTPGEYANYFLNFVKKAKYLDTPTLDQSVVVSAISTHYPHDVQVALAQNNCDDTNAVLSTLQIFDQLAKSKQPMAKFNQPPVQYNNQQKVPNLNQNQKYNQQRSSQVNHVCIDNCDFTVPPPSGPPETETNPLNC